MSEEQNRPVQPESQPPSQRPPEPGTPPPPPPTPRQTTPPVQAPPPQRSEPPRPAPGPDRSQQAQDQVQEIAKQAESMLTNIGIDMTAGVQALIIALVAGVVAALLDEILGLPTNALRFAFGWMGIVAVLSGMIYPVMKRKEDLAGLVVGMASGAVAYLAWFIVMEIISDVYLMNIFKALLSGLILGAIGVGWLMLLHFLPSRLPK